jgi:glycosyltransferase involved in cell wall biosynthesis
MSELCKKLHIFANKYEQYRQLIVKNRDFIITSLQSWDIEIGSTIKNTALEISKQNRVLYLNPPMDFATRLRALFHSKASVTPAFKRRMEVLRGEADPIRAINHNLWVVDCPFVLQSVSKLPAWLFDTFNKGNNRQIGRLIVKEAAALGFKNYIHLIDTDIFRSRYLKELIRPAVSVYYRRDYVIGEAYWRKHGPRCEQELAASADIVLANSTQFAAELSAYNPNTFPIETGVNLDLYDASQAYPTPEDISTIPHPIVGYLGTVNSTRLDAPLLCEIARQRPAYSFVFTGPEDDGFRASSIHSLANVYFLGQKTVGELPDYLQAYDVCINPQMVNPITDGNYPLKIDEYLAMGKPAVATSTHTMRDIFAAHTHLATNLDEWLAAIDEAVTESGDKQLAAERVAFAQTHSWGHSVSKIYTIIENYLKRSKA